MQWGEGRGCGHSGSSLFGLSFQSLLGWTSGTHKHTGAESKVGLALSAGKGDSRGSLAHLAGRGPSWQRVEACPMLEDLPHLHRRHLA